MGTKHPRTGKNPPRKALSASGLTPAQRKLCRELSSTLLKSAPDQQERLINQLLELSSGQELPGEIRLKHCQICLEALLAQLLKKSNSQYSGLQEFFLALDHLPLPPSQDLTRVLPLTLQAGIASQKAVLRLFKRLELLYLLTGMGEFSATARMLAKLEDQVDADQPELYILYRLAQATFLRHRGDFAQYQSLWLKLVCEVFRSDGAAGALHLVLLWIIELDWGRSSAAKKALLQKIDTAMQDQENLLSEIVLFQLFSLEDALVGPNEKMIYAVRLICRPTNMLNARQLQYVYFFAGNFSSGREGGFQESIRFFQQSNYFLHRNWVYLRNLSRFLRENLTYREYHQAMPLMERRVMELGNQVSLQNNAFVEKLNADYSTISELYKKVEELSLTDNLTGLRNRRFMENNLQQMFRIAARHNIPVCLAIMDIDLFKLVNDAHGHLMGDRVLAELTQLLLGSFRKSDIIIRYGGDEFLVILFDTLPERAVQIMEELREVLADHVFGAPEKAISITVSVGIAYDPHPFRSEEQMLAKIAKADSALYLAKNSRRNKVVLSQ